MNFLTKHSVFTAPDVKTWIRHSEVHRFDLSGPAKYFLIPLNEQTKQNKNQSIKRRQEEEEQQQQQTHKQTNKEKESEHV